MAKEEIFFTQKGKKCRENYFLISHDFALKFYYACSFPMQKKASSSNYQTLCSWGSSTKKHCHCLINWLSQPCPPNHSQAVRARELKFLDNVHLPPPVTCQKLWVTCHVSPVIYQVSTGLTSLVFKSQHQDACNNITNILNLKFFKLVSHLLSLSASFCPSRNLKQVCYFEFDKGRGRAG